MGKMYWGVAYILQIECQWPTGALCCTKANCGQWMLCTMFAETVCGCSKDCIAIECWRWSSACPCSLPGGRPLKNFQTYQNLWDSNLNARLFPRLPESQLKLFGCSWDSGILWKLANSSLDLITQAEPHTVSAVCSQNPIIKLVSWECGKTSPGSRFVSCSWYQSPRGH